MNFMDAVDNLIAGKRVLRKNWSGCFLAVLPTQKSIWYVVSGTDEPIVKKFNPSIADLYAEDWLTLTDKEK